MMMLVSILVLGVLVFVHELGHFLVAKMNGIAVVEFSIGFGRKIFKRRIGETIYSIGILPLGGYVRMAGDDPREVERQLSGQTDPRAAKELEEERSNEDPEEEYLRNMLMGDPDRWFLNKGYLAKSAVVIAGPAFNLIFAFALSAVAVLAFGAPSPVDKPIIGDVMLGYPAQKSDMRAGDEVLHVDNKPISTWIDFANTVASSGGKEMVIGIRRTENSAPLEIELRMTGKEDVDELASLEAGEPKKVYRIGVKPKSVREPVGPVRAVEIGALNVWVLSRLMVKGLWGMIQGSVSTKNLGGPIFIFKEAADSAKAGIENLFHFMIFLSVSLAILNLLPIPILDGGHLVFFTIELLKGSPVSLKIQEYATQVGMLILLLLMVFAVGNDIRKIFEASL